MSTRTVALGLIAAATAVAAATAGAGTNGVIRVALHPLNGSRQSGVATLTPTSDGYIVVVQLSGKQIQPGEHDHIHTLSCARYARIARHPNAPTAAQINKQLATVSFSLNDIYHGRSKTTVPLPLARVTKGGFSINVHEPGPPYTALACGDIPTTQG